LFYGEAEHRAYLPVKDVMHAILNEIGFDGWVSMELFNRVMERKDHEVVEELAARAAISWERLSVDLRLDSKVTGDRPVGRKAEVARPNGTQYRVAEAGLARL
jgi:4-hydroxyphenylpyruvate dioxygenase